MEAYKLFRRRKDGTFGSLYHDTSKRIEFYSWERAEMHPVEGLTPRKGWHCLPKPHAPHLSTRGRVWCRLQIAHDVKVIQRPQYQGGEWYIAEWMRIVEVLPTKKSKKRRKRR